MRRTWTIIAVRDVFSSLKWYQALLGLTQSTPEHDYFGQVLDADGTVLLCLHRWGMTSTLPYPVPGMENPGMACSWFFALTTLTKLFQEHGILGFALKRNHTSIQARKPWSSLYWTLTAITSQ